MDKIVHLLCIPFLAAIERKELFLLRVPKYNNLNSKDGDAAEIVASKSLQDLDSSRSYAQILAIAALVLELLQEKRTISLRDVYYTLKKYFRSQNESDSAVLQLGRILGLKRYQMNIIPASKGLIAGATTIRFLGSTRSIHCSDCSVGNDSAATRRTISTLYIPEGDCALVSPPQLWMRAAALVCNDRQLCANGEHSHINAPEVDVLTQDNSHYEESITVQFDWANSQRTKDSVPPRWLLVVEKEGIFRRLLEDEFLKRVQSVAETRSDRETGLLGGRCLLITGCGYPDVATRACVRVISSLYPDMKVVGVCDYNPHGLSLLLSYRFRSNRTAFEASHTQTGSMRWLGLRSNHIQEMKYTYAMQQQGSDSVESCIAVNKLSKSKNFEDSDFGSQHFQALTANDRRKLQKMLNSEIVQNLPSIYAMELSMMLETGIKCEIESSYSLGLSFLPRLLLRALVNTDYV